MLTFGGWISQTEGAPEMASHIKLCGRNLCSGRKATARSRCEACQEAINHLVAVCTLAADNDNATGMYARKVLRGLGLDTRTGCHVGK